MFMQRSNSDSFLNDPITGPQTDFGSYDSNIDPFLAGLTADMYIDPINANQAGLSDPMNIVHTPTAEFDMPLQDDDYNNYSAEDLWANLMAFDQSINEDVQPMMIPNVMNSSNNHNQMEFSQSCPQPMPQRPAAGMFNYPVQSSPLANHMAAPPSSPSRLGDRKGRMAPAVREQGGIRALFSGPRGPQSMDKQPLRRSASANGKLGIRKKSQLSPRVMKATLPGQDPGMATSDMQAAYRMNQELATNHDSFDLSQSVPLSSPVAIPFNDGFHVGSPTPIYNSFSGYEDQIRSERRRSTSLPPGLPPSSLPTLGVQEMGNMQGGNAFSAPNTPQTANHSLPVQIPRSAKAPPQTVAMSEEEQQRKLDEQLLKIDFDDITVAELKEMLRERKKATNGKKADLVQRLLDERRMVEMRRQGKTIPPAMPPANAQMSFSVPDNWFMTA